MRKFAVFELILVVFVVASSFVTWSRNITFSTDLIPSIINGLVASVSVITGFSGAIMVFTLSKQWEKLKLGNPRPVIYFILIAVPLALLWTVYSYLLDGDFITAIKLSMEDLAIAMTILVDFLAYYIREVLVHMRENTPKGIETTSNREEIAK